MAGALTDAPASISASIVFCTAVTKMKLMGTPHLAHVIKPSRQRRAFVGLVEHLERPLELRLGRVLEGPDVGADDLAIDDQEALRAVKFCNGA